MKSARDEFGPPPAHTGTQKLEQNLKDLQSVREIGQQLKQSGVTQDQKQANLALVKNDQGSQSAHKDMGVKQGERPALSPCDGKMQANTQADIKQAGQSLQNAGATKSAAQQFAPPAQTPSAPAPAVGGRSR